MNATKPLVCIGSLVKKICMFTTVLVSFVVWLVIHFNPDKCQGMVISTCIHMKRLKNITIFAELKTSTDEVEGSH